MILTNAEKKIKSDQDINLIVDVITKSLSEFITSIVLYGSYGREEGAYYSEKGAVLVYNDYDILLVVKKTISNSIMTEIEQTLSNMLDVRWIDLSQKTISKLKQLKPLIFNFDLKYGSLVIWGESNVLKHIPAFEAKQLTLRDAEILYFTRLYTFLGSLDGNGFIDGVQGEESRFFRNQMAKAVLAIVDVLLLQKNSYHTSYCERVERFEKLYPQKKQLVELSRWALEEKLTPRALTMNPKDTKDFYTQVLYFYHEEMFIALSKFYGKKISITDDLVKANTYSLQNLLTMLKTLILTKTLRHYWRQKKIQFIQSYAVEFFIAEENKQDIFNKCKVLLKKINPNLKIESVNSDTLRDIIVKLSR